MRQNPNESEAGSDRIDEATVAPAGAGAERAQLDSELLRALAAAVERNEWAQERFRNAVVKKLARLEARGRVLQGGKFVHPLRCCSVGRAAEQVEACEALISEMSEEIEWKMFKEISVGRDGRSEAGGRHGRPRKWSDWEI